MVAAAREHRKKGQAQLRRLARGQPNLGGLEAQANVLVEAGLTDGLLLGEGPLLLVEEDGLLLLVCFLATRRRGEGRDKKEVRRRPSAAVCQRIHIYAQRALKEPAGS